MFKNFIRNYMIPLLLCLAIAISTGTTLGKYIAELNDLSKITMEIKVIPEQCTLNTGEYINSAIKATAATKVVFGKYADYEDVADKVKKSETKLDAEVKGTIRGYMNKDDSTYYILCKGDIVFNADSAGMFKDCTNLETIEFLNTDTTQVELMDHMFYNCQKLRNLDVANFNTDHVTDMKYMFYMCKALNSLTNFNFNTEKVEDMQYMFYECENVKDLDVSKFNTSGVENMDRMFYGCRGVDTLDVSKFNTSNVKNMDHMFYDCRSVDTLDVSNFHTSEVKNMSGMFAYCINISGLNLTGWNTSSVTDMSLMFKNCEKLELIYVDVWDLSKVSEHEGMFTGCAALIGEAGTKYNTDSPITDKTYARIDRPEIGEPGYYTEVGLNIGSAVSSAVRNSNATEVVFGKYADYSNIINNTVGDVLDIGEFGLIKGYSVDGTYYILSTGDTIKANRNSAKLFYNCSAIESIAFGNLDTSKATTMYAMFSKSSKLRSIDLSSLDTTKVTDMSSMFFGCTELRELLNLSNLKTSEVTNMNSMFNGCENLTSLDMGNFDTKKVTDMGGMFNGCSAFTGLELGGLETPLVTNMEFMFYDCSGLTSLDISKFDTAQVTNMSSMFNECSALKVIYVGDDWSTSKIGSNVIMFDGCSALVGGAGTKYSDAQVKTAAYAHADGGADNPGYLTHFSDRMYTLKTGNSVKAVIPTGATKVIFGTYEKYSSNIENATQIDVLTASGAEGIKGYYSGTTYYILSSGIILSNGDCSNMFSGKSNLTSIIFENFNTVNTTNMKYMFSGCTRLTSAGLDVSGFNTISLKNMEGMFNNCTGLVTLDLINFDTTASKSRPAIDSTVNMFNGCSALKTIYVGDGWSSSSIASGKSTNMFAGCTAIVGGAGTVYDSSKTDKTYAHIDGGTGNPGYLSEKTYTLTTGNGINGILAGYPDVTSVVFGKYNDYKDTNPELVSEVKTNGTTLDSSGEIKGYYSGTTYYILSSGRIITHGDCKNMFNGRTKLKSIEFNNFDTTNTTNMSFMFNGCSSLEKLDLSTFNTVKLKNMNSMFANCTNLTEVDLSSFDTSASTYRSVIDSTQAMFSGCGNLKTIKAGDKWGGLPISVSTDMFAGCNSLVGGCGTAFDSSKVDAAYAHIDEGTSNPGYFTDANPVILKNGKEINAILTQYYADYNGEVIFGRYEDYSSFIHSSIEGDILDAAGNGTIKGYAASAMDATIYYILSDEPIMANPDSSKMFNNCDGLYDIEFNNFYTNNVKDMSNMFYNCRGLTSLNVSNFNTSNVTNMMYMFYACSGLRTIFAGDGWDTSKVIDSGDMFYGCTALVGGLGTAYNSSKLDAAYAHIDGGTSNPGYFAEKDPAVLKKGSDINTAIKATSATKVVFEKYANIDSTIANNARNNGVALDTAGNGVIKGYYNSDDKTYYILSEKMIIANADCTSIFSGCAHLTTIIFENFNTANVANMSYMFYLCNSLTDLDLSSFDTTNVADMSYMFYECMGLKELDLSNFNTSNVTNMESMFNLHSSYNNLTELNVSNFDTSKVENMRDMFAYCKHLTELDLTNFNTEKVANMSYMFSNCEELKTIYAGDGWDTSKVTDSGYMFGGCTSLVGGLGTAFDSGKVDAGYARIDGGTSNPGYLTDANPAILKTGKEINAILTQYYANGYGEIIFGRYEDYSSFIHSSIEGDILDEAGSGTIKGYAAGAMDATIYYILSDEPIMANPDSSKMFNNCNGLYDIEFNNFNTNNVTDMSNMFNGCIGLTSLDVSNFETSNVTDMGSMFEGSYVTTLDLSHFETSSVTNMSSMFKNCYSLQTITVENGWDITQAALNNSADMFTGCTLLVGGAGTTYSASNSNDASYARPDMGTYGPGYFTGNVEYTLETGTTINARIKAANPNSVIFGKSTDYSQIQSTVNTYDVLDTVGVGCIKGYYNSGTYYILSDTTIELNKNSAEMFKDCARLQSITFNNIDTSEVEDMSYMFSNCDSLSYFDFSNFDTSNVTNISGMFSHMDWLQIFTWPASFDTSNVTDMSNLFADCIRFRSLNIRNLNTSSVTNMSGMFSNVNGIATVDMSNFDTRNVRSMNSMFKGCTLGELDLSSFKTSSVTDMGSMFEGSCVTALDLSHFETSNVTNMSSMFKNCYSLQTITVENGWDITQAALNNSVDMFTGCTLLVGGTGTVYDADQVNGTYARVDKGPRNPGYFTGNVEYTLETGTTINARIKAANPDYVIFGNCADYSQITSNVNTYDVLDTIGVGFIKGYYRSGTYYILSDTTIELNKNSAEMFKDCARLQSVTFNNIDTSEVEDMSYMFSNCDSLSYFDFSNFDTRNVTNISGMFSHMDWLQSFTWPASFDTSNVTDMSNLFADCIRFRSLNITNLNTSSATNMSGMFINVNGIATVDMSNFDTRNVRSMNSMFKGCTLGELDLSSFKTSSVTDMGSMFEGSCVTTLDLSHFETSSVTNMSSMFKNCYSLQTITVENGWDIRTDVYSTDMFTGCTNLVGGAGTTYSASNSNDTSYARPDMGTYGPGYFTGDVYYTLQTGSTICGAINYMVTTNVIFGMYDDYPTIAQEVRKSGTALDTNGTGTIKGYLSGNTYYILSDGLILANPDSSGMFNGLSRLQTITFKNFNTKNVTNTNEMFYNCTSLYSIYATADWTIESVQSSTNMFTGCTNLSGGAGTRYVTGRDSANYARIDGVNGYSGYFRTITASTSLALDPIPEMEIPEGMIAGETMTFVLTAGEALDMTAITAMEKAPVSWLVEMGEQQQLVAHENLEGFLSSFCTDGVADDDYELTLTPLYSETETYRLTVNWIDEKGTALAEQLVTTELAEDSEYTTEQKEFEGYTYKEQAADTDAVSGIMDGDKTVTYVYTKNVAEPDLETESEEEEESDLETKPEEEAEPEVEDPEADLESAPETYTLTVNWVDEEGNALAEEVVMSELEKDSEYSTEQKEIEGYDYKEQAADTDDISGIMDKNKRVVYVYTKKVTELESEEDGDGDMEPGVEPEPDPETEPIAVPETETESELVFIDI